MELMAFCKIYAVFKDNTVTPILIFVKTMFLFLPVACMLAIFPLQGLSSIPLSGYLVTGCCPERKYPVVMSF